MASSVTSPAHCLWAALIARIYAVFPLLCPVCGGQMRLIAFFTEGAQIRKILEHIGVAFDADQRVNRVKLPALRRDMADAEKPAAAATAAI